MLEKKLHNILAFLRSQGFAAVLSTLMLTLFSIGAISGTLSVLTDIQCVEFRIPEEKKNSAEDKKDSKTNELDDYESNYSHLNDTGHIASIVYGNKYSRTISFYLEIPSPPPDFII